MLSLRAEVHSADPLVSDIHYNLPSSQLEHHTSPKLPLGALKDRPQRKEIWVVCDQVSVPCGQKSWEEKKIPTAFLLKALRFLPKFFFSPMKKHCRLMKIGPEKSWCPNQNPSQNIHDGAQPSVCITVSFALSCCLHLRFHRCCSFPAVRETPDEFLCSSQGRDSAAYD